MQRFTKSKRGTKDLRLFGVIPSKKETNSINYLDLTDGNILLS